jgi:integrase
MGRRSTTNGVAAVRGERIRFDFRFRGKRYRPSILKSPTEANLRRARERLIWMRRRIADGTFCFEEEFPDFRDRHRVLSSISARTCNQVFEAFLTHCEARVKHNDLANSTLAGYRKILDGIWRPAIGALQLLSVRHSMLLNVIDHKPWSKKTYNNAISVLRRAFALGFQDFPAYHDPAAALKCLRLRRHDRPKVDPFTIQDAETLIATIHAEWGEAQGNYDEFRFFTGLRPSEQIALTISDFDAAKKVVRVNKARIQGVDRDSTKTDADRHVELCPRALEILKRQLMLREQLISAGRINHDLPFFEATGAPIATLNGAYRRWRKTLKRLCTIRYRKPYAARHCSVSWNLMVGKRPLWVAKQHGHSLETMLRTYTAWADGAVEGDIKHVKRALAARPDNPSRSSRIAKSQIAGVDAWAENRTAVACAP